MTGTLYGMTGTLYISVRGRGQARSRGWTYAGTPIERTGYRPWMEGRETRTIVVDGAVAKR